jgi:hypothetical protein
MVATFAPTTADTAPSINDADRPRLRLIQGGAGGPGPTRATFLRRRAVAFVLMVTCVVAVTVGAQTALRSLVASPGGGASAASGVTQSTGDYLVQPGDTLWSVAAGLTPAGSDVRATVDRLAELNGGPVLTVGQRLALPE